MPKDIIVPKDITFSKVLDIRWPISASNPMPVLGIVILFFKLEANYFTILWWFLPYIHMFKFFANLIEAKQYPTILICFFYYS